MRFEIFALIAVVGAFVWAFRALPMRLDMAKMPEKGALARFFAATGVAAPVLPHLLAVARAVQVAPVLLIQQMGG